LAARKIYEDILKAEEGAAKAEKDVNQAKNKKFLMAEYLKKRHYAVL
jgi:hypothetical protein